MATVTLLIDTWKERLSEDELLQKRQELGSRAFSRGFQQNALSDAEKLFPHFEDCLVPGVSPQDLINREFTTVAGLDLAGKTRRGTCMLVLGISPDAMRIRTPLSVQFGAWTSKEIAFHVVESIRTWDVRHTKVEDNSLQDSIIELIELTAPGIELSGFTTSWNKRDPDVGLPSLDREFERGMWVIADPHADRDVCPCDYCKWIHQMKNYPAVESADGVMSCWFAREAALELGPGLGEVQAVGDVTPGPSSWSPVGSTRFGGERRRFSWRLSTVGGFSSFRRRS